MTAEPAHWNSQYGADFIETLREVSEWGAIEALWRVGGHTHLPALAAIMAQSGNQRLGCVLAQALEDARYVEQVPQLPDLLHAHRTPVTEAVAGSLLERLDSDENPFHPTYLQQDHLVIAWLLSQPGEELDMLALTVAFGDHKHADTGITKDAAIARIAGSADLGAKLIERFAGSPDSWSNGQGWTRSADVVARVGNHKGRATLIRAMTAALMAMPPGDPLTASTPVREIVAKHAAKELALAFAGAELANCPGTAAAVVCINHFDQNQRDELIEALASKQNQLWAAHRDALWAGWDTDDWDRMLTRWSSPGAVLINPDAVLDAAPDVCDLGRVRVAVVHGTDPGDRLGQHARAALQRAGGDQNVATVDSIRRLVPWDLAVGPDRCGFIAGLFDAVVNDDDVCAAVLAALVDAEISVDTAARLLPASATQAALIAVGPVAARAELVTALADVYGTDDDSLQEALRVVIAQPHTLDVVEAVAAWDVNLAFESFGEDRWHELSSEHKDDLLGMLETHAQWTQAALLDRIAGDTAGANADRRGRAAVRWAQVAPRHSVITDGVLSLLASSKEQLVETFAAVAATVQPRDEPTLSNLKDKWISGGKTGKAARAALDTVASGVIASLDALHPKDRRDQCAPLLGLLGVTASAESFAALLSYVGSEAIDDNVDLRRAAASAIRAYTTAGAVTPEGISALGEALQSEADPDAASNLAAALAAAKLGDDAAILSLYDFVGLAPDEIAASPDELFGSQKPRLLKALKKMQMNRAMGEPGWEGYVEQMDLVAEALVRAAYLRYGPTEHMKTQIAAGEHNKPDYGSVVGALRQAQGLSQASASLTALHNTRTTRTNAHHETGGKLDSDAITQAEGNLRDGALSIITKLATNGTTLRAVPSDRSEDVS